MSVATRTAFVFVLIASVSLPRAQTMLQARVSGSVTNEAGESVGDFKITMSPDEGRGGMIRTIKVKKNGSFSSPFFPKGKWIASLDHPEYFIKSMSFYVTDNSGLEKKKGTWQAHPVEGLPGLIIPATSRVELTFVLASKEVQKKLRQEVMISESSKELKKIRKYYDEQKYDKALAEADELLEDSPENGGAHYMRGVALWKLERFDEAEASLVTARERLPENETIEPILGAVLMGRADQLSAGGEKDAAVAKAMLAADLFRAEIERRPGELDPLRDLAAALDRASATGELVPVLEQIVELDPAFSDGWYRLAQAYDADGDREKSLAALSKMPLDDPAAIAPLYNLAVRYFDEKEYETALFVLEEALRRGPDVPNLHQLRGRTFLAMGQTIAAIASLKRFVELAPDHPQAEQERQAIEMLEKSQASE